MIKYDEFLYNCFDFDIYTRVYNVNSVYNATLDGLI